MESDRSTLQKVVDIKHQQRASEVMPLVRLVAGAAPVMEALTHNEHWDKYLTYIQGIVERWTVSRDATLAKLTDSNVWNHEELLKLKSDVLIADATIQALLMAIDLPKAIMGGEEEAIRLITDYQQKYEQKDESARQPQS